jgi:phosphomannomutase
MRHMMQETEGMKRVLIDGIKIMFEANVQSTSVLMWPDRAKPLFHVYAESKAKDVANSLATQYEEKIVQWRDTSD